MFEGRISRVVDYFGGAAASGAAQAYLVEHRDYTLRAHFHPSDQFQILLGAPGSRFGRRPVGDLAVHYADACTVYGPLQGGDPPLRYFTLRAEPTEVTSFMPESRALLAARRAAPGRSLHADVDLTAGGELRPGESRTVTLLHDDRDGLRVEHVTAGPDTTVHIGPTGRAGAFCYLAAGAVTRGDAGYEPQTLGWQPPGDEGWTASAGPSGAALLVLRYPEKP
jgi:hypothetical protein